MSQRYTQDRATTQRHLAILKDLLKQPDNRLCADCKRNDPRWASTNLGCWLCIRCSGHHRGMGVHISRVRSVDLDTWTPDQIRTMQRWGNRRANLYWEAHLKPGHMPPDHKIDSFIRSKYELRRWARDGPLPEPETLDEVTADPAPATATATSTRKANAPAPAASSSSSSLDLLSSSLAPASRKSTPSRAGAGAETSLFDLDDFGSTATTAAGPGSGSGSTRTATATEKSGPTPTTTAPAPAPKRDPKADILSLFNAAPPLRPSHPSATATTTATTTTTTTSSSSNGGFGQLNDDFASLSFGAPPSTLPRSASTTSDFGGFASAAPPPPVLNGRTPAGSGLAPPVGGTVDPWATSSSVWGTSAPGASSSTYSQRQPAGSRSALAAVTTTAAAAKPDPFADFGAFTSPAGPVGGGGGGQFGGDIWGSSASTTSGAGAGTPAAKSGTSGGFSDIWG